MMAQIMHGLPRMSGAMPTRLVTAASVPVIRIYPSVQTKSASLISKGSSRLFSTSAFTSYAEQSGGSPGAGSTVISSPSQTTFEAPKWTPTSRRVGLIARKKGMCSLFLPDGKQVPATILQVSSNQVSAHIGVDPSSLPKQEESTTTPSKYIAIQVAATDSQSVHGVSKQVKGHLHKAGIEAPKKFIREFPVTPDAIVSLGTHLSAAHFVPGQKVDVRAITRGKGFQGVMKRWGFKGQPASHGVSLTHRSAGATGAHQDPGRVFPGKKMAGRMGGNKHATIHNLDVLRIDLEKELVYVKGVVPGPSGGHVTMRDAEKGLVGKAANAAAKGLLLDGTHMNGNEPASAYLPNGIQTLPFPAGTRELAKSLPVVVEAGVSRSPSS